MASNRVGKSNGVTTRQWRLVTRATHVNALSLLRKSLGYSTLTSNLLLIHLGHQDALIYAYHRVAIPCMTRYAIRARDPEAKTDIGMMDTTKFQERGNSCACWGVESNWGHEEVFKGYTAIIVWRRSELRAQHPETANGLITRSSHCMKADGKSTRWIEKTS